MLGRLPRLASQLSSSSRSSFSAKTPDPSDLDFLKNLLSELEQIEQNIERLSLNDNFPTAPTSLQQNITSLHLAIRWATADLPPDSKSMIEMELPDQSPEDSNISTRRFPTSVSPIEYVPRSRNK